MSQATRKHIKDCKASAFTLMHGLVIIMLSCILVSTTACANGSAKSTGSKAPQIKIQGQIQGSIGVLKKP